MEYNTLTLSNGLRIIHLASASPVVYCGYCLRAGTRDEAPGDEGLAHFCEHMTFKGTTRRKAMNILNRLESVGGDLNAFTNKEDTVFYAAVMKGNFMRAADLLTDIVFHSTYPQNEIAKEVEVICDEIECYNDSPAELIYDEFDNIIFAGHPLGHNILGSAERLRNYTRYEARRFTSSLYRPENAVFFVYGNVSFNHVRSIIETLTANFGPSRPLADARPPVALPALEGGEYTVNKDTHQAHVMIGNRAYSSSDSRRYALFLLNNIFGGPGMNARLNIALREKRGLVYTVDSSMVSYSDTGLWNTYFGCDPHDVEKCLSIVRHEMDKLTQKPMKAQTLGSAKKQLKGQIGIACDNRENFAIDFGKSYLHYGVERDVEQLMKRIDEVTPEDILAVAQDIFDSSRLTTLIYL